MSKQNKWLRLVALSLTIASVGLIGMIALTVTTQFSAVGSYMKIKRTKDGIEDYKKTANENLRKLMSDLPANQKVRVTITSSRYLSRAQLYKLFSDYDIEMKEVVARTVEQQPGGLQRGTMAGLEIPSEKELAQMLDNQVPSDTVDQSGKPFKRPKLTFKGFIEVKGYVPKNKIEALSRDPHVYLVDPAADSHLANNPRGKFMSGLSWILEDEGMVAE